MVASPNRAGRLTFALLVCALSGGACAGLRVPRIDPSGNQIFLPAEASGVPALPVAPPAPPAVPAMPTVPTATPVAPAGPPAAAIPPGSAPVYPQAGIIVTPSEVVAPVGAEVLLVASVAGAEGLLAGNRVEWMLDPSGVGHIVALEDFAVSGMFLCRSRRAQKVSDTFAVGRTSAGAHRITCGTPDPSDDVTIQPGQAWVTITSSIEGTSYVMAVAPDLGDWDRRKALTRVHWVDAQWVFPPPGADAAGARQVLTSRVTRLTDGSSVPGWRVRYEILGGSPAGFAPSGAHVVDVETDGEGNARAEVFQKEAGAGVTHIGIQIIRPPLPGQTSARSLVLAAGTTTRTWGAPDIALKLSGPEQASPGSIVTYHIDVTNPGNVPNRGTTVQVERPAGLIYVDATPAPAVREQLLEWTLGEVPAGQTTAIMSRFRVGGGGTLRFCATARTAGGLTAQDCANTTVVMPSLDVQINGPTAAQVGSNVRFEIVVTNRGVVAATKLIVTDSFDDGLKHIVAETPIERDLGDLAPGASSRIPLNFQITKPGELCHRVEVTGTGNLRATAKACVTATMPEPQEEPQPAMEVTKTGPPQGRVGEPVEFVVRVKNTGNVPLMNVCIADMYEQTFTPTEASEGWTIDRNELKWTFARVDPGQTRSVRIRCKCVEAAVRACNRVIVTSDGRPPIMAEACLEILPPADADTPPPAADPTGKPVAPTSRLAVSIVGLDAPVRLGGRVRYQVLVKNQDQGADYGVKLTVTFSDHLVPTLVGTTLPARYRIKDQSIQFDAVAEIRPGETLTYVMPFETGKAGETRVVAEVESRGAKQPIRVEETTEVLEP